MKIITALSHIFKNKSDKTTFIFVTQSKSVIKLNFVCRVIQLRASIDNQVYPIILSVISFLLLR